MNEKKCFLAITFLLVFAILFSTISRLDRKKLATDSGFDSSWDSGGSSSDSSSDWGSSDSSSGGGGNASPEFLAAIAYFITVPLLGDAIRKKFRKNEDTKNDIEYIYGMALIFPFMFLLAGLVEDLKLGLLPMILIFAGFALLYFGFVILWKKSLKGIVKYEYITLAILLVLYLLISIFIFKNDLSVIFSYLLLITLSPFFIIYIVFKIIFEKNKIVVVQNQQEVDESIEKLGLDKKRICSDAFEIYKRIQIAWMNDTIDDVSDCLSSEMSNMYKAQLATLRVKKQQNVMSDFEYVSGNITYIKDNNNSIEIKMNMIVKCKDYLINKESGKVLRGNKNKINNYNYEFAFLINREKPINCPNCGKELPKGGEVNCPYCNSIITLNNGNMMMTKKRMISQS